MVFECFTWIPFICAPLKFSKRGPIRPLPDDVTVEILSRLPLDCVLECRRVCKNWRALTSSPYFAELHLQRATTPPSLFFHYPATDDEILESTFLIYDKTGQNETKLRIRPLPPGELYHSEPMLLGSCNGLLMFLPTKSPHNAFVFNPITQELITVPSQYPLTRPCGIYFHPSTREYKLLLSLYEKGNNRLKCYYTYSLKSKVWKKLDYSSSCRTITDRPAILVNESLHWMVTSNKITNYNNVNGVFNPRCKYGIMVFGIETEDFRVLPHPGDSCPCHLVEVHENMHLLGTRDCLYLCDVTWDKVIHVWVLEDYTNWGWDMRYRVNLNGDIERFPYELYNSCIPRYEPCLVDPLGLHNGELVIRMGRGISSCNLEQNFFSKVAMQFVFRPVYGSAYTKSLISLE